MLGSTANGPFEPSEWVGRFAGLVPPAGHVLDIAAGNGRHSRLFRELGHPVTAIDRDVSRFRGLPGIEAIEADLEDGSPWPISSRFDGVVVTNYLWRPILGNIVAAVADGGVLIYETFAAGNEVYGKPSRPEYLLRPGELLTVSASLRVVAYSHGVVHRPRPAAVQRICAVRSLEPQPLDESSRSALRSKAEFCV